MTNSKFVHEILHDVSPLTSNVAKATVQFSTPASRLVACNDRRENNCCRFNFTCISICTAKSTRVFCEKFQVLKSSNIPTHKEKQRKS